MSEAGDRISSLPDSLLHHIISFLEIKDGARTGVLSHRWNSIWTTVPTLNLLRPDVISPPRLSSLFPSSSETDKFMDFVDGTLHRHNSSNVENFLLYWRAHLNESRLHSWISTVIRANVKQLSLFLYQNQPLFIPLSLFTCQTLTSLELGINYGNFTFPKCIFFPRLKSLRLYEFEFTDECWSEELFSNSSALEELNLDLCVFHTRNFCISIPTLKLLSICSHDCGRVCDLQDCALKIHAPSLLKFTYWANVAKEYALSSFLGLVEAVVQFNSDGHGAQISRLLGALAHVRSLTVNDVTLQAICSAYGLLDNLLTFHNVKMLKVSEVLTTDQGLIALFKAVPNLESLVFDEYINDKKEDSDEDNEDDSDEDNEDDSDEDGSDGNVDDRDDDSEDDDADSVEGDNNHKRDVSDAAECDNNDEGESNFDNEDDSWALDVMTTGCLFPHLKSVCFKQSVGNPREIKWVKLILRNAKALQTMTICYCDPDFRFVNAKNEEQLMVEIPRFPRASPDCVFRFCSAE